MTQFPQLNLTEEKGPKATIKTNMGDITVQLFPEEAPKTVKNFIELAKKGYYDGVIFHRVIPDFMIQGATQLVLVWVAKVFTVRNLKMSFHVIYLTCVAHYQWQMLVRTQMAVNSLS